MKGGTTIIRAHRKVKDQAWADETGWDNWFLIRLDGRSSVEEAITSFRQSRYIEEATPEYYAYTTAVPNDTHYTKQWGHNNTAQLPGYTSYGHTGPGVGTVGFDSDAQLAWDLAQGYGDPSIIIAIIDSGVDTAHEDLRLVTGYDYGDNDDNPMDDADDPTDPDDSPGHGTSCAGIAAARANNGIGVAGIAGGCSVMPLKVADSNGELSFTSINNAITHAADNGAHIISMSFGAEDTVQG
ncbi:MAG: S8 family serine peptidase, partial [Candidatus Cloacimonetes bacterium]|nr:S8 family serine peptidase [Candidatus Cloacimonadota bacterium]